MNPVAVHRVSFECVSRFSLIHRESGEGFSGRRIVNSRGRNRPIRRLHVVMARLITSADSFEVGRLIGSYGFVNITSYSGLQSGSDFEYTSDDIGRLKAQDIGEGGVKIRLYEGRISQGPSRGTPIIFKVYPVQRAGDMMAANELNAHSFLQSKSLPANLLLIVGGFETQFGEQWLAFRDGGKDSAVDYSRIASEKISRARSQGVWNPYDKEQMMKRRRNFVIKILQGAMKGLAFMHDNDRLHQSLGPSSIVLNTPAEREAIYLIPRLRDLAFSVDIRALVLKESTTDGWAGLKVESMTKRRAGLKDKRRIKTVVGWTRMQRITRVLGLTYAAINERRKGKEEGSFLVEDCWAGHFGARGFEARERLKDFVFLFVYFITLSL